MVSTFRFIQTFPFREKTVGRNTGSSSARRAQEPCRREMHFHAMAQEGTGHTSQFQAKGITRLMEDLETTAMIMTTIVRAKL